MTMDRQPPQKDPGTDACTSYRAPEIKYLGTLAELTQFLPPPGKETGAFDGTEVLGIQLGDVS